MGYAYEFQQVKNIWRKSRGLGNIWRTNEADPRKECIQGLWIMEDCRK